MGHVFSVAECTFGMLGICGKMEDLAKTAKYGLILNSLLSFTSGTIAILTFLRMMDLPKKKKLHFLPFFFFFLNHSFLHKLSPENQFKKVCNSTKPYFTYYSRG